MTTIKSYSDLQQSKKLAEILPLESADMTYRPIMDIDSMSNYGFLDTPECYPFNDFKNCIIKPLPCWSLAALFNVLRNQCNILEIRLRTNKEYNVFAIIGDFVYNSFKEHPDGIDMIDGLYELTLMLNKEKLL